jgi:parvulin-like peptidyl-prolyl isomerase
MRFKICTAGLLLLGISVAGAQVASHAPTPMKTEMRAKAGANSGQTQAGDKAVARVNGAVLTERDLLREMYAIFPYARQHNGFPKEMEAEIRKGALEMIIFEELVYQDAERKKMTIASAKLQRAESDFRKQFPSRDQYQEFLKAECRGSAQVLHKKIERSLLIEAALKSELQNKAAVSLAEAKAYYDKNPKQFERAESFSIQTISIIPPENASAAVRAEARRRADEALKGAKATKNYRDFGLLAEKVSDDDWHVNMGDRKQMEAAKLPPPLVEAARKMKPGDVSDLLQFGPNYTLFRLNGHTPAGKEAFEKVRAQIQADLQRAKYERLRSELHKNLRGKAKVEIL